MILQTNVKLNFGLNVIRKRPDGYHGRLVSEVTICIQTQTTIYE